MLIIKKIENDKKLFFTGLAILFLIILFLNSSVFNIPRLWRVSLGLIFSTFYFLFSSLWLGRIFSHFFGGGKEFKFIVGLFLTFYLIALGLAVPIVLFKITPVYFYIFLLIFTLIISFLNQRFSSTTNYESSTNIIGDRKKGIRIPKVFYFLFFIFYFSACFFIIKARTGDYILSPWDVISKYYQVIWFALAFLLVLFIFSKLSAKKILFLLILTSFLFHAYLPFVSENSFGVDRWRHVGAERRLMAGNIEPPALIGDVSYAKIGPVFLPKVLMMPNKFSYSNQWGMTIGLSWLTGIDILKIDQYLIWFLWSIFFTIFVYKIAQLIFEKEKLSLLITFVALFCFFSLQVGGAITVPHAIGFLPFLFFLMIFFSYLKNTQKKLWPLIIFSLALLIFNYVLYLILAIEIFIFGLILKSEGRAKKIILPILIIIFILSLPLLDRLSGTSFFLYQPLEALKKLPEKVIKFTNLISYFYYKFNQHSYLPNLIKNIRWQIIFPPLIILFTILGLVFHSRLIQFNSSNIREIPAMILAIFLLIFLANQFISFSFMKDYRLLSTRLSNVLMLFLVIFFTAGIFWLIETLLRQGYTGQGKQNLVILILAIFLATLSLTTYASGPAYGNVTNDELAVAKYLNQEIIESQPPTEVGTPKICVFDSGWRLLALEAVNGMIAGNFPTDPVDFIQKEKDELYRQMLKNPSREILDKTLEITNAKKCFFVVNQSWLNSDVFDKIKEILGEPVMKNNTYIWRYTFR